MLTEQQHKIVRRVQERLEQFPETHSQDVWYRGPTKISDDLMDAVRGRGSFEGLAIDVQDMRECGTTACLAGHAVLAAIELGIEVPDTPHVHIAAADLLGLSGQGGTDRLFSFARTKAGIRQRVAKAAETGEW